MVVDIGKVRQQIKPKADSTLYNMRKKDLISYVRTLENNYNVAVSFNENQARYIEPLGVTAQKWIPVTERLPVKNEDGTADAVLVTDGWVQHMAYFIDGDWLFAESGEAKEPMCYVVTHWMPLPEPPKEEA